MHSQQTTEFDADVIVAGGGPSGTTAATLLSQYGWKILLIDRDQHPRFHIGESLLPMAEPIFKRLGIDWNSTDYQPKHGAEFIDESVNLRVRFPLASQYQPHQVERASFDLMMIDNAASQGVDVHQVESVQDVVFQDDKVSVRTDKQQYVARYFIDATGRSAFMGRRTQSIQRIDNLGKFAFYTHFSHVQSEASNTLFETGDVKIILVDIGWFWVIPLSGRRLSVGLVVQKDIPSYERKPTLFERYLSASPLLMAALSEAKRDFDLRAEADFSFTNQMRHGQRYACCGDSGGFLDPVFSSGVFLAIKTAEMVADRLHTALQHEQEGQIDLHSSDDEAYALGFNSMRMFVDRFYHARLVHNLFSVSERSDELKQDILGLLGGDLWTGTNEFQKKLLKSRQAQQLNL